MSRLFAYLGSDQSLLCQALEQCGESLCEALEQPAQGWGVGYYREERALVQKRPGPLSGRCDLRELCAELQSTAVLAHLRQSHLSGASPENTQPFRYRNWLFGHLGRATYSADANQAMLDRLPNFLQHNVRGDTDSELALHFFFASLRDYGRVDRELLPVRQLMDAAARTVRTLRSTLRDADQLQEPALDMLFCSGRLLVAVNAGPSTLASLRLEGLQGSDAAADFRAQLLAFDPGELGPLPDGKQSLCWTPLPAGCVAVVDEHFELHVEPLDAI